jgi:hypothetical protein
MRQRRALVHADVIALMDDAGTELPMARWSGAMG